METEWPDTVTSVVMAGDVKVATMEVDIPGNSEDVMEVALGVLVVLLVKKEGMDVVDVVNVSGLRLVVTCVVLLLVVGMVTI